MTTQRSLTLKQAAAAASVLFLVITSVCAQDLRRYEIKPSDLPPPNPAEDAVNPPRVVPRPANAQLTMPPGFSAETFAEGDFREPRWLALAPNGDVFLSDSRAGKIITGYKIIRIRFKNGKPVSSGYEDFLVGWMMAPESKEVWGRPVGLLFLRYGSMLITHDGAYKIWRVSYRAPK